MQAAHFQHANTCLDFQTALGTALSSFTFWSQQNTDQLEQLVKFPMIVRLWHEFLNTTPQS